MSRKTDYKTKDDILEKVLSAMSQNGLNDLSLRDIAREVGISARMLVYHFESYENLLNSIFVRLSTMHKTALKSFLSENPGKPIDEIFTLIIENVFTDEYRTTLLLFLELYAKALRDVNAYNEFFNAVLHNWIDEAETIIHDKHGGRSRLYASVMVSFYRGLMLDWLASGDKKRAVESSNLFMKLIT
jgi:AcrR family transcriptional regulator